MKHYTGRRAVWTVSKRSLLAFRGLTRLVMELDGLTGHERSGVDWSPTWCGLESTESVLPHTRMFCVTSANRPGSALCLMVSMVGAYVIRWEVFEAWFKQRSSALLSHVVLGFLKLNVYLIDRYAPRNYLIVFV